jgi:hypothetical protein
VEAGVVGAATEITLFVHAIAALSPRAFMLSQALTTALMGVLFIEGFGLAIAADDIETARIRAQRRQRKRIIVVSRVCVGTCHHTSAQKMPGA